MLVTRPGIWSQLVHTLMRSMLPIDSLQLKAYSVPIEQSYKQLDTVINEHEESYPTHRISSRISRHNVVHYLQKGKLLIAINSIAGLSIFFFGYDQGMMGGVNNAEDYYNHTMHFGYKDPTTGAIVITNAILQGTIVSLPAIYGECNICVEATLFISVQVSVYYLGTLCGCLFGGSFGDQHGRIKTIGLGAAWAVFGALLQTSAQNQYWMTG